MLTYWLIDRNANIETSKQTNPGESISSVGRGNTRVVYTELSWCSNFNVSHLALQLSLPSPFNPEYVAGAVPTGDAPTTSGLSTIILLTKVRLILEVWR